MGLLKQRVTDALELFVQQEERFAASVHEDFDAARTLLRNAKVRAAEHIRELQDLAATAKSHAKYLQDHFSSGGDE